MEVIRALQRQLQEAQAQCSVKQISERSCIELVHKLLESGVVELLHTTNGQEWLTPAQLDREIRETITANGGRVSVAELPGEIGVAFEHCERHAELISRCQAGDSAEALIRVRGDLVEATYLSCIVHEIEESLMQEGCIAVSDLVTRYDLPADFLRDNVLSRVSLDHVVKQSVIYTSMHSARVEARLRGVLRGSTHPISIEVLSSKYGVNDIDMVTVLVQKMINNNIIHGKLSGVAFTPKVFADAQASRLDEFYRANQYLTSTLAKSVGITVKEWVQAKGAPGYLLSNTFVADTLVAPVLAYTTDALTSESWVDVQSLLPPALSFDDAGELVAELADRNLLSPNAVILDRFVLSSEFVTRIARCLDAETEKAAQRTKEGKKSFSIDETNVSRNRRRRVNKANKAGSEEDDDERVAGVSGLADSGIENSIVIEALHEHFSEVPPEIHEKLCAQVQSMLTARVAQLSVATRSEGQTLRITTRGQAEKLVQERYERLVLGSKALECTRLQDTGLYAFLLQDALIEPLHVMIATRLEEAFGKTVEVNVANRKRSLDRLVAAEGSQRMASLTNLHSIVTKGKETHDIADLYHKAAEDCHIYCRKVDKRREKQVLQDKRAACRERLRVAPVSDLHQLCVVGLQAITLHQGVADLQFPGELWALQCVAERCADEVFRADALVLVAALKAKSLAATQDTEDGLASSDASVDLVGKDDAADAAKVSKLVSDPVALEAALFAWKDRLLSAIR